MTISIKELQEKWDNISPVSEGFLLVSENASLSFHIGYVNGENKCLMLINTGEVGIIPSSQAIQADCVMTKHGEYGIRLVLHYSSLDELFVKLCWDLINASVDANNPLDNVILRYKSWMRLLKQIKNNILSSNQQKGLIAELLYLEEKITQLGENTALNSWLGPEGSDQDFVFENTWSEIKATSIASTSITISSIQQLDCKNDGLLVVYFIDKITANNSQTLMLPTLISSLEEKLSAQNKDYLLCKLAKTGYFAKDAEYYSKYRYKFKGKNEYLVDSNFPKLTRNNIPVEIENVRYELSIASINSFKT